MNIIIDDRFLLFALDRLYRKAMKAFERTSLLIAARRVASVLDVEPGDVPVEGYYSTDNALTEYFQLMRALQNVPVGREREVAALPEFQQLWAVCSSPIFGRVQREGLMPQSEDALTLALKAVAPDWTVTRLVTAAREIAVQSGEYSLVGLASRTGDAVVLAAVRESVVLYSRTVSLGLKPTPTFEWRVDPELAMQANRFVQAFNALVPDGLPAVVAENAPLFYDPDEQSGDLAGRCVKLGDDGGPRPARYYHWAICKQRGSVLCLQEFWADEVWTTQRYTAERTRLGRCIES